MSNEYGKKPPWILINCIFESNYGQVTIFLSGLPEKNQKIFIFILPPPWSHPESGHNRPLKFSQLLCRVKKFKLLRMSKYATTLNFFAPCTWNFWTACL